MHGFVFRHFEKAILAGFIAWFGGTGSVALAGRPASLTERGRVVELVELIDDHMKRTTTAAPAPDIAADVRSRIAGPAAVGDLPSWCTHRRPNLLGKVDEVEPGKPIPSKHLPPSFSIQKVGHGRVELRWAPNPANENADVVGYELRRRAGTQAWRVLATPEAQATAFVDTTVEPATTFEWELVETAAPATLPGVRVEPLAEPSIAVRAEGRVPADIIIGVLGGDASDPVQGLAGRATVRVHRWHAATSEFVRRDFHEVAVGSSIGAAARVKAGGAQALVDFATGAELRDVTIVQRGGRRLISIEIFWKSSGKTETIVQGDESPDLHAR